MSGPPKGKGGAVAIADAENKAAQSRLQTPNHTAVKRAMMRISRDLALPERVNLPRS
jgi:hypothetical protein